MTLSYLVRDILAEVVLISSRSSSRLSHKGLPSTPLLDPFDPHTPTLKVGRKARLSCKELV